MSNSNTTQPAANPSRRTISKYSTRILMGTQNLYGKLMTIILLYTIGYLTYNISSMYAAHAPIPGLFEPTTQLYVIAFAAILTIVGLSMNGREIQKELHKQRLAHPHDSE